MEYEPIVDYEKLLEEIIKEKEKAKMEHFKEYIEGLQERKQNEIVSNILTALSGKIKTENETRLQEDIENSRKDNKDPLENEYKDLANSLF